MKSKIINLKDYGDALSVLQLLEQCGVRTQIGRNDSIKEPWQIQVFIEGEV